MVQWPNDTKMAGTGGTGGTGTRRREDGRIGGGRGVNAGEPALAVPKRSGLLGDLRVNEEGRNA